jgi:hypothetical protein
MADEGLESVEDFDDFGSAQIEDKCFRSGDLEITKMDKVELAELGLAESIEKHFYPLFICGKILSQIPCPTYRLSLVF